MEIKTKSEICITVGNSGSSKVLLFDKPVRAVELTREESLQVSSLLADGVEMPRNNATVNATCSKEQEMEVVIEPHAASILAKIESEAKRYMSKNCFTGHDFSHVLRVQKLCKVIGKQENADMMVLLTAALLHDLGRNDERKNPSIDHAERSAEIAKEILQKTEFPCGKIPAVLYAIRVHRFSKGMTPTTLEAKILQDADRIDISGAIGIATTFAYSGVYNRELYDINDPFAERRSLNDSNYSIDHFYAKLLNLPKTMHTKIGKQIAERRTEFTKLFLRELKEELSSST
jgi:uncharacterized protein